MQTSIPSEWHQPALHPTYLRLLCALLGERGVDTGPLLADARLSHGAIGGDAGLVAWAPVHVLIAAALERSECPWLGLVFGAAAQLHTHGSVGNAAVASSTLGAALTTIARYARLRTLAVHLVFERGGAESSLRIVPAFDLGAGAGFMLDALLVIIERMLEALCGQRLRGARYCLPQSHPIWASHYREFLSGSVEFAVPGPPTLIFANSLLDQRCITADAGAYARAAHECDRELERLDHAAALTTRVRALLQSCSEQYPTAAAMARQLHLSPRSLFRQLANEDSSYRELVDLQRSERACWLLEHTALAIERIAERLGYADPSNFSRTFKRWKGVSPREFRRAHSRLPR